MTTLCIVQARTGSSRLPGKVLTDLGGRPILERILYRLMRARSIDTVLVATSTDSSDDPVADLADRCGIEVVRGSAFDVLDRFHTALDAHPDADVVVRITADCPFVDPDIVDAVVGLRAARGADFAANRLPPPSPRTFPVGLDVEVATVEALRTAWRDAASPHQREHVMPFLYENGDRFAVEILDLEEDLSGYRWTVDTPADLEAVRALQLLVGPEPFGWRAVLDAARSNPAIGRINSSTPHRAAGDTDSRWPWP